jgi:hypothetical protein
MHNKIRITQFLRKEILNGPGNYRGISLVSYMGKLFTSLLNNRLTKWSENSSVLTDAQFGFRGLIKFLDINIYSFIILSIPIALSRFNLAIHKSSSFSSNGRSNSSNTVSVVSWFINNIKWLLTALTKIGRMKTDSVLI